MTGELPIDDLDGVTGGTGVYKLHKVEIELSKGTLTFTTFTCNGNLLDFGVTWTPTPK